MKVLYATDGFDAAGKAGSVMEKLGDRDRLDITVMSVTHTGIPAPEHAVLMLDPIEERRRDTVDLVDAACEKLVAAGFHVKGHTAEGHPGPEIVRAISDDWFDLVVMGGSRRSWLGSHLLGSVSSYVLHSSPWPVMIVHEALPSADNGRVLIGTDGSRGAEFTIAMLAQFADPSSTAMKVVSVVQDPAPRSFAVPESFYVPSGLRGYLDQTRKRVRDHAEGLVESASTELRDAGFDVQGAVLVGHPTEQLLREANQDGFDLVAVGSRGLGPVRRALMGSVSEQVVQHAKAALVGRRLQD